MENMEIYQAKFSILVEVDNDWYDWYDVLGKYCMIDTLQLVQHLEGSVKNIRT